MGVQQVCWNNSPGFKCNFLRGRSCGLLCTLAALSSAIVSCCYIFIPPFSQRAEDCVLDIFLVSDYLVMLTRPTSATKLGALVRI